MAESIDLEEEISSMQTITQVMFGTPSDTVVSANYLLEQELHSTNTMLGALFTFERNTNPTQKGFSTILEEKDELDFFRNMRVTKHTFNKLLTIVKNNYSKHFPGGAASPISAKTCLQIGLWYLGNNAKYREIAATFGYTESSIFMCVQIIIRIMCSLTDQVIKWPRGPEAVQTEKEFKDIAGFPGVLGAIDGCHIEVKPPNDVQADFLDRHCKHSVNLMAVCDAQKRYTFIYAGFPGSAHDSRVFKNSELYHLMDTNPTSIFPSSFNHIIGDSAFQLSPYLMVPYKDYGNLTRAQRKFNTKLSKTRVVIENSFAWLKGRFQRLTGIDADYSRIPDIIKACCVLHNITINEPYEDEFLMNEMSRQRRDELNYDIFNDVIDLPVVNGREKRDFIKHML